VGARAAGPAAPGRGGAAPPPAREIRERAGVDAARIDEIEAITHHDVIAFTTAVAERVGPSARWFHFGLTSSDVLDTAQALQMVEASDLVLAGVDRLHAPGHRSGGGQTLGRGGAVDAEHGRGGEGGQGVAQRLSLLTEASFCQAEEKRQVFSDEARLWI
jgi:hypothetical protein